MAAIEVEAFRVVVDAAVTAVSVPGGAMAYFSGDAANKAITEQASAEVVAQRVNEGLAAGFEWGTPVAVIAFIIVI